MKRPALILICLLLQACSATTKELGNSLWDSLFGTPGVQLTDDDIQNMPYASQYMQLNGGPQLFVVLAFAEIEVNNLAADPLIKPAQIVDGATWTRTMGWTEYQQVRYATARSVFKWDGTDTVKVGSDETLVRVLDEEVSTDQARWHNRYWIDSEGQIRQSEQYLGADYFPVKTTLIKAAKQ
ncbi:YjbF family lipoprotein [Escherichia coli]|nr:YjbF family lipoprotein [Escherichia coli]